MTIRSNGYLVDSVNSAARNGGATRKQSRGQALAVEKVEKRTTSGEVSRERRYKGSWKR